MLHFLPSHQLPYPTLSNDLLQLVSLLHDDRHVLQEGSKISLESLRKVHRRAHKRVLRQHRRELLQMKRVAHLRGFRGRFDAFFGPSITSRIQSHSSDTSTMWRKVAICGCMRTMLRNSWKLMVSGCCVFTAKTIETYFSAARATSVI